MKAGEFIQGAISRGSRLGLEALTPLERALFLVSELEVLCDMEGTDSFVDRYGAEGLSTAAALLAGARATRLADALLALAGQSPGATEALFDAANDLASKRDGYDYVSLEAAVVQRLAREAS